MTLDGFSGGPSESDESLPEILLPTQIERTRGSGVAAGEKRLLWAILLDAVACFCKYRRAPHNAGRKLFREAEHWIRSSDHNWPFSFQNVCDTLGLNPSVLRVSLVESVYGSGASDLNREMQHNAAERRVGQPRTAGQTGLRRAARVSRIRSHGPHLGDRGASLARTISRRRPL